MASDDHVKAYTGYMDRIRAICKFFDQRFSVIPVAWFWRHRFRAMALFMRGTNIATFTPGAPLSTLRAESFLCCAPSVHHGSPTGLPRLSSGLQTYRNKFELKELLRAIFAKRRQSRHEATEPHIVPLTEFHLVLLQKVRGATDHPE